MSDITIYIDSQKTRNQYRLRVKSSNEVVAIYCKDEIDAKRLKKFIKKTFIATVEADHESIM